MHKISCIIIKSKKVIRDRTKEFIQDEIREIQKYKWIESEKAGHDTGEYSTLKWIENYACQYRKEWEEKNGKIIEEVEIDDGVNCSGNQRQPVRRPEPV